MGSNSRDKEVEKGQQSRAPASLCIRISDAHLPSGPPVSWPVPVGDAMRLCGCRAEGVFSAGIFNLAHSAGSGLERAGNYTGTSQRPQPLRGLCSEQLEVATPPCDLDADGCSHSDVHVVTRI